MHLGLEQFTFDGTQFLITLERRGHELHDLQDQGISKFSFKSQAIRDRFAVALENMAAGRQWDQDQDPSAIAEIFTIFDQDHDGFLPTLLP